jgi:hypothetical protein
MSSAPDRVTVTLPEEVKALFGWIKNHDGRFEGKDASIAAFLIKMGAEAFYEDGLKNVEPLDLDVANALAESVAAEIARAASGSEQQDSVAKKHQSNSHR